MNQCTLMKISFDFNRMDFDVDFVNIDKDNLLEGAYKEIGCNTIDIVSLEGGFTVIVDDEGFLVSDNPVFALNNKIKLAGTLLVGKTEHTDDGRDITNCSVSDAYEFFKVFNDFGVMGKTK